jgi:hypothetical protein
MHYRKTLELKLLWIYVLVVLVFKVIELELVKKYG